MLETFKESLAIQQTLWQAWPVVVTPKTGAAMPGMDMVGGPQLGL